MTGLLSCLRLLACRWLCTVVRTNYVKPCLSVTLSVTVVRLSVTLSVTVVTRGFTYPRFLAPNQQCLYMAFAWDKLWLSLGLGLAELKTKLLAWGLR